MRNRGGLPVVGVLCRVCRLWRVPYRFSCDPAFAHSLIGRGGCWWGSELREGIRGTTSWEAVYFSGRFEYGACIRAPATNRGLPHSPTPASDLPCAPLRKG